MSIGTVGPVHVPNLRIAGEKELRKRGSGSFDFRVEQCHNIWYGNPSVTLLSTFDGMFMLIKAVTFVSTMTYVFYKIHQKPKKKRSHYFHYQRLAKKQQQQQLRIKSTFKKIINYWVSESVM